jgi:dihydroorotate dehydrogenase
MQCTCRRAGREWLLTMLLLMMLRFMQAALDAVDLPDGRPPLLVKISPDLSKVDKDDVAAVALERRIDGLVVGNTTLARPGAIADSPVAAEAGGISGPPLFEPSTNALREMYARTGGLIPLIGCGGVSSGRQAYAKIKAGASLVELYTSLVRS